MKLSSQPTNHERTNQHTSRQSTDTQLCTRKILQPTSIQKTGAEPISTPSCTNQNAYEIIACYLYIIAHPKPNTPKHHTHQKRAQIVSLTHTHPKPSKNTPPEKALTSEYATYQTSTPDTPTTKNALTCTNAEPVRQFYPTQTPPKTTKPLRNEYSASTPKPPPHREHPATAKPGAPRQPATESSTPGNQPTAPPHTGTAPDHQPPTRTTR